MTNENTLRSPAVQCHSFTYPEPETVQGLRWRKKRFAAAEFWGLGAGRFQNWMYMSECRN